jgi:hypothetical protein
MAGGQSVTTANFAPDGGALALARRSYFFCTRVYHHSCPAGCGASPYSPLRGSIIEACSLTHKTPHAPSERRRPGTFAPLLAPVRFLLIRSSLGNRAEEVIVTVSRHFIS